MKKPKMGRPRRARAVADGTITIRVTPEERKRWEREARKRGCSLSTWVREQCAWSQLPTMQIPLT